MNSPITIPALFFCLFGASEPDPVSVKIETIAGAVHYQAEIADNSYTQMKGLMHRQSLGSNAGMLFTYDEDRIANFWMKNVPIPLDILFIDHCGKIVEIVTDAKPEDPTVITSSSPVRAVLEIAGGASKRAQMRPGDQVVVETEDGVFENCVR